MNIDKIIEKNGLRPLKIPLRDIPHLTLETNQTCNLKCRTCYNLFQDSIKSLDQIKAEIDLALTKRRLETITLIGGEPTLHPDLEEIIAYIKSKGLICQLLTNGIRFEQDKELAGKYKKAGLDRILLHVDEGQKYPADKVTEIINNHFRRFQEHRIYFALSVTIYRDQISNIPQLMRNYAKYSFFDGILATIERDTHAVFFDTFPGNDKDLLESEYYHICAQLGISPTSYLPSSNSDREISWLIWFYYINPASGICLPASRRINHLFRRLYRFFMGREFFAITVPQRLYFLNILVSILLEFLFNPLKLKIILRLCKSSEWLTSIRYQYIVLQDGPYFDRERNALRLCYHCPDATIRNGKITPVCVADLINPLNESIPLTDQTRKVYEAVYRHLDEWP